MAQWWNFAHIKPFVNHQHKANLMICCWITEWCEYRGLLYNLRSDTFSLLFDQSRPDPPAAKIILSCCPAQVCDRLQLLSKEQAFLGKKEAFLQSKPSKPVSNFRFSFRSLETWIFFSLWCDVYWTKCLSWMARCLKKAVVSYLHISRVVPHLKFPKVYIMSVCQHVSRPSWKPTTLSGAPRRCWSSRFQVDPSTMSDDPLSSTHKMMPKMKILRQLTMLCMNLYTLIWDHVKNISLSTCSHLSSSLCAPSPM